MSKKQSKIEVSVTEEQSNKSFVTSFWRDFQTFSRPYKTLRVFCNFISQHFFGVVAEVVPRIGDFLNQWNRIWLFAYYLTLTILFEVNRLTDLILISRYGSLRSPGGNKYDLPYNFFFIWEKKIIEGAQKYFCES